MQRKLVYIPFYAAYDVAYSVSMRCLTSNSITRISGFKSRPSNSNITDLRRTLVRRISAETRAGIKETLVGIVPSGTRAMNGSRLWGETFQLPLDR
jgi:hypothetical protein